MLPGVYMYNLLTTATLASFMIRHRAVAEMEREVVT